MLTAKLYIANDTSEAGQARAERRPLNVGATLRDDEAGPLDAQIVNLSTSGCLVRVAATLQVPSNITIGISGIGRLPAWIMRRDGDNYGCFFLHPLSEAAVAEARALETVVPFAAPTEALMPFARPAEPPPAASSKPRSPGLSYRVRAALIILCALAAWGVVAAMALIVAALVD